jgi:hypothetical protein
VLHLAIRIMRDEEAEVDARIQRVSNRLRPYRSLLLFATGTLATFYGRHLNYTLLFAQAVGSASGWPAARRLLVEFFRAYAALRNALPWLGEVSAAAREASDRLSDLRAAQARARQQGDSPEADVLETEIAMLEVLGSSLGETLQHVDPRQVGARTKEVYGHASQLTALATANGARKVGVSVDVADSIGQRVNRVLAPLLYRALDWMCEASETVDQLYADIRSRSWIEWACNAICVPPSNPTYRPDSN